MSGKPGTEKRAAEKPFLPQRTSELIVLSELRTDRVRFEWHPVDDGRGLQRRFQL